MRSRIVAADVGRRSSAPREKSVPTGVGGCDSVVLFERAVGAGRALVTGITRNDDFSKSCLATQVVGSVALPEQAVSEGR